MGNPKVLDFEEEHILRMILQPQQEWLKHMVLENPDYAKEIETHSQAFSVEDDGDIIYIGGCTELHPGVGEVWAIFSHDGIKRQGSFITRGTKDFLNMLQSKHEYHRLFTTVDVEFDPGHRWVKILGFHKEALLKKYRSNQGDSALYVRL